MEGSLTLSNKYRSQAFNSISMRAGHCNVPARILWSRRRSSQVSDTESLQIWRNRDWYRFSSYTKLLLIKDTRLDLRQIFLFLVFVLHSWNILFRCTFLYLLVVHSHWDAFKCFLIGMILLENCWIHSWYTIIFGGKHHTFTCHALLIGGAILCL